MVELADSAHGLKKGPKSDDLSSVGLLDGREGRMGRRARQSEPVYCPFECARFDPGNAGHQTGRGECELAYVDCKLWARTFGPLFKLDHDFKHMVHSVFSIRRPEAHC